MNVLKKKTCIMNLYQTQTNSHNYGIRVTIQEWDTINVWRLGYDDNRERELVKTLGMHNNDRTFSQICRKVPRDEPVKGV